MTFDSIKLVYIDNIAFNSIGSFFYRSDSLGAPDNDSVSDSDNIES